MKKKVYLATCPVCHWGVWSEVRPYIKRTGEAPVGFIADITPHTIAKSMTTQYQKETLTGPCAGGGISILISEDSESEIKEYGF